MPSLTGREQFFEVARSEGVTHLFANPGTTELPIFDELADETGIELILALQEATAVAAADGYAMASRGPALVNLHIAPGVGNGVANIFNAAWSRSPVVVTAGQQHIGQIVQEPMLAADLVRMVDQFCKWSYQVERPEDIAVAMRRAFKVATTPPTGPVFLAIPWNHLDEVTDTEIPARSNISHASPADPAAVRDAVARLARAERPLIIAGDEVARADAVGDLVAFAERMGIAVAAEPLHSRLVFPMQHPLWRGGLPPVNAPIRALLEQHDVVLAIGAVLFAPFFYSGVGAVPPGVELIQVDTDAYEIGKTYPVALGLLGDVRATLRAFDAEAERTGAGDAARAQRLGAERAAAVEGLDAAIRAQRERSPWPALAACAAVVDAFDGDVNVVDEAVTNTAAVRTVLRNTAPDSYFFFRGGGLGWGIPASAGVALARPERRTVAIVGDGATCYVPQSLWTLAHHDIPSTVVVLNNGGYYILKSQLAMMNQKAVKFDRWPGMDIADPAVDFMALARAFGVPGERAEKADEITALVRKGLASDGPMLIEVPIDATVRPLG